LGGYYIKRFSADALTQFVEKDGAYLHAKLSAKMDVLTALEYLKDNPGIYVELRIQARVWGVESFLEINGKQHLRCTQEKRYAILHDPKYRLAVEQQLEEEKRDKSTPPPENEGLLPANVRIMDP
jgi:hypothetical protein